MVKIIKKKKRVFTELKFMLKLHKKSPKLKTKFLFKKLGHYVLETTKSVFEMEKNILQCDLRH